MGINAILHDIASTIAEASPPDEQRLGPCPDNVPNPLVRPSLSVPQPLPPMTTLGAAIPAIPPSRPLVPTLSKPLTTSIPVSLSSPVMHDGIAAGAFVSRPIQMPLPSDIGAQRPRPIHGRIHITEVDDFDPDEDSWLQFPESPTPVRIPTGKATIPPAMQTMLSEEFKKLLHSVQQENPTPMFTATANLLPIAAEIPNPLVHLGDPTPKTTPALISSIKESAFVLFDGLLWLFRVHGTTRACKTIFALLVREQQQKHETRTGVFQSGVQLKMDMYNNLANANLATIHWVAYKYNPGWLTHARTAIVRIGLPALGLATAVVFLLIVTLSISTLGIPAIALTLTTAVSTGVYVLYEAAKAYSSSKMFEKHVLPRLSPEEVDELQTCLPASHKYFGPTLGDYYRYHLSVIISEAFCDGFIERPALVTQLPVERMINVSLVLAAWTIIKEDVGYQGIQNLLHTAKYIRQKRDPSSRMALIKLFFPIIRKNR